MTRNHVKPTTHQCNLVKLPMALVPLIERPQWCVWRWTQKPDGKWQKPPFMATQPDRHASTNDPNTWADYATALATVQAGHADGISYILTKDDPFGAIDLDHCRDKLCSIDVWAQNFMQAAVNTYQEVTPSGEGVRIWGFVDDDPLNRKFTLERRQADCSRIVPTHQQGAHHYRLPAQYRPTARQYRQGIRLGSRMGRTSQGRRGQSGDADQRKWLRQ